MPTLICMNRYVALLGVGARRDLNNSQALAGEQIFGTAGCAALATPPPTPPDPFHPMTELRNQTIHPYTDLLLHDMGPGLADNMGEENTSGSEWRTRHLFGILASLLESAAAKPISMTVVPAPSKKPSSGMVAKRKPPKKPSAPSPPPTAPPSSNSSNPSNREPQI